MKNVGIIIQKLKNGGAERAAANLSKDLIEKYNVYLIVFDASDITYEYEGKLIDLKLPPKKGKLGKFFNMLKRIQKVKKIKKQYKIDYCISFMEGANIVNILSKRKEKIITSERNLISFFSKGKFARFKVKYVCKKANKIVSLSKLVKEDLVKNFNVDGNKIVPIYNSCSKERLNIESKEIQKAKAMLRDDEKYIINMGRLNFQKGQWHIIKAMKIIKGKIPNAKLIIMGQGELEETLKQLSKNLGLEKDIIFLGYIKNPHTILNKCEAFVFSSLVEGLGNVLLEALAFDKAIISTDCFAGPREILAPNTNMDRKTNEIEYAEYGILIPNFPEQRKIDENDLIITKEEVILANAVIELLTKPELKERYEKKAKERIKNFSPECIKQEWINLLESLER